MMVRMVAYAALVTVVVASGTDNHDHGSHDHGEETDGEETAATALVWNNFFTNDVKSLTVERGHKVSLTWSGAGAHNVVSVGSADDIGSSCNLDDATTVCGVADEGNCTLPTDAEGTFFYTCSVDSGSHCSGGQYLTLVVSAEQVDELQCVAAMYDTEDEAKACAEAKGKTAGTAHAMGDKWMPGAADEMEETQTGHEGHSHDGHDHGSDNHGAGDDAGGDTGGDAGDDDAASFISALPSLIAAAVVAALL